MTKTLITPTQRWPIRLGNHFAPLLSRHGMMPAAEDVDELMAAACRATGLEDFGETGFREPLALLLSDIAKDKSLHPMGRFLHRQFLLRFLKARLRLEAAYKETPAMAGEQIVQPLIILGLPRTGTTRLFNILARDERHRTLSLWESYRPTPAPTAPGRPGDLRRLRARFERNAAYFLGPDLPSVHHLAVDGPEECIHLLSTTFLSYIFLLEYDAPQYHEYFLGCDQEIPYRAYGDILKYLQTGYRRDRWLLKSPTHIFGIEGILKAFPDALFVHTHRDPLKAVASSASLALVARGMGASRLDPKHIGDQTLHHLDVGLNRLLDARHSLSPERILDIHYEETVHNPMGVVEAIYDKFGFELPERTRAEMSKEISTRPQHFKGRHSYNPADFGYTRARIDQIFGDYQDRFEIPVEP